MKTIFERHAYAPELNKVHLKRGNIWYSVPAYKNNNRLHGAAASLAEYRASCKLSKGNYTRIKVSYVNHELSSLNRTYSGKVNNRASLLAFYQKIKAYHNAGQCRIVVEYLNVV